MANTFTSIRRTVASLDPSSSSLSPSITEKELREIKSIIEDLEEVEQMAESIEAVLVDAEERQIREESVRLWLRNMRDLANQVQNLRDVYKYDVMAREVEKASDDAPEEFDNKVCSPISSSVSLLLDASYRGKIADEVCRIKGRCKAMETRRNSLHLRETDGKRLSSDDCITDRLPSGSIPSDPVFLGREYEVRKVIGMLRANHVDGLSKVEVIAVIGMGGVGKTTLSQHVYKDPQITSEFEMMGWVYVSPDFDVTRLTKAMIESLSQESCHFSELSPMQEKVTRLIQNKKVLLVLDDVWNENIIYWDIFIAPIIYCANNGSKILITTRLEEAAHVAMAVDSIRLESLSVDDGWKLLRRHAIPGNVVDAQNLEELEKIGRLIVKKCGSLPLAIKVLGSLLRSRVCSASNWRNVLNSSLLDYGIKESKQILGSLYLSYLHLSPKLKACLKFCCIYPKDMIQIVDIENFLMGHDLIDDREEVKKCLRDLESRSFIQLERIWIRMHDHVYDLVQYISEENHVTLKCRGGFLEQQAEDHVLPTPHARVEFLLTSDPYIKLADKRTLWMEINPFTETRVKCNMSTPRICISVGRSLRVLIICVKNKLTAGNIEVNLDSLKCLRVLRFEGLSPIPSWIFRLYNLRQLHIDHDGKNFRGLDAICKLKNLQSMIFRSCEISSLPESISMLINLQELELIECSRLKNLPESVSKLIKLQELSLEGCSHLTALPSGIVNLTNLQSLNLQRTGISYMPKGFGGLIKLKYLSEYLAGSGSGQARLGELKNLVHLEGDTSICFPCGSVCEEDMMQDNILGSMGYVQTLSLYWGDRRGWSFSLSDEHNFDHIEVSARRSFSRSVVDPNLSDISYDMRPLFPPLRDYFKYIKRTSWFPGCSGSSFPDSVEQTENENQEQQVLESLRPHCNIREIYISDYRGGKLASWMGSESYTKLVRLQLRKVCYCTSLSPIYELPSLSNLGISYMQLLEEMVPYQNPARGIENAETSQRLFFPKLQKLYIDKCCKLETLHLRKATSLKDVEICCCLKLKNIELPRYMDSYCSRSVSIGNCPEITITQDVGRSWVIRDKVTEFED